MVRTTLFAVAWVALAFVAIPVRAPAQDADSQGGRSGSHYSLLDEVGDFGRSIFGVNPKKPHPRQDPAADGSNSGQAQTSNGNRPYPYQEQPSRYNSYNGKYARPAQNTTPAAQPAPQARAAAPQTDAAAPVEVTAEPQTPQSNASARMPHRAPAETAAEDPPAATPAAETTADSAADPTAQPLHARMEALRRSAFASTPRPAAASPAPAPATETQAAPSPSATANQPLSTSEPPAAEPAASRGESRSMPHRAEGQRFEAQGPSTTAGPVVEVVPDSASRPQVERPAYTQSAPPSAGVSLPAPAMRASSVSGGTGVLLSRQSPILSVETTGPRKIVVGREASYEVNMQNSGDVAADETVVFIDLPAWADVNAADASAGTAQFAPDGNQKQLQWRIGRLEAKSRERLLLRLVPRESRPFDLAIRWDFKQTASQTMIEVQEPKLTIRLEGPREVAYGHSEVFKIKVANVGTGDAENTMMRLLPTGTGENLSATHAFGTIPAGEERAIEVELTARQAGTLSLKADVQCDGGTHAETAEQVLVRRGGLAVELDGPKLQFVDTVGTYRIRVTNPGSAAARQVVVSAAIPAGGKFLAGSEGFEQAGSIIRWKFDSLAPSAERVLELKCSLTVSGSSRMEVTAAADDDLSSVAAAVTRVEAMADLAMEVVNPPGPVALGDDAPYELRVFNRGTKAAENVEIVTYFSQGCEPTAVQGAPYRVGPGQVTFNPVPFLAPGKDLRLKITAKASVAGSHIFRAEVHCRPLGARLVRDETTHFYATDGASGAPMVGAANETQDLRSADRRGAAGMGLPMTPPSQVPSGPAPMQFNPMPAGSYQPMPTITPGQQMPTRAVPR